MFRFVAVLPLAPLAVGQGFSLSAWPLHVTLVSNFATELDATAIGGVLDSLVTDQPSLSVRIGEDALFGRFENVPVSLVKPSDGLSALHRKSVAALAARGVEFDDPDYLGDGYRPHVTVAKRERVRSGDVLVLPGLALVDMAPAGDSGDRRVVWTATFATSS